METGNWKEVKEIMLDVDIKAFKQFIQETAHLKTLYDTEIATVATLLGLPIEKIDKTNLSNVVEKTLARINRTYDIDRLQYICFETNATDALINELKLSIPNNDLIRSLEQSAPIIDSLKTLSSEDKAFIIKTTQQYINEQLEKKLQEINIGSILQKESNEIDKKDESLKKIQDIISTSLNHLFKFFAIAPDNMKDTVYALIFLHLMAFFLISTLRIVNIGHCNK